MALSHKRHRYITKSALHYPLKCICQPTLSFTFYFYFSFPLSTLALHVQLRHLQTAHLSEKISLVLWVHFCMYFLNDNSDMNKKQSKKFSSLTNGIQLHSRQSFNNIQFLFLLNIHVTTSITTLLDYILEKLIPMFVDS